MAIFLLKICLKLRKISVLDIKNHRSALLLDLIVPLTPKSIGIVYQSSLFMIPRKVNIGEISVKLMSGQDLAYAGQTDGQMDDMRHNKIRS